MEIRRIEGEEVPQAFYVASHAFMAGSRDMSWLDDPNRPEQTGFAVWEGGGLQATVVIEHYRARFGSEVVLPLGGIAGVACLAPARGRGYAGAGLRRALEHMRESGQVVSALFPFSWDYYRRFGWEWVGATRRYTARTASLPADGEAEHVRMARAAERAAVEACYAAFTQRYRGAFERDARQWNAILDDTEKEFVFTYLYDAGDGPEGYITYRGGRREHTGLREFVALTGRAQLGLLGVVRRQYMQWDKVGWSAPPDDALWSRYQHWDLETRVSPATQARVVDVPAALRAWKPAPEARGSLVLVLEDEAAPWNAGTWSVAFEGGAVEARPGRGEPDVSLDIQALSQAYFGTPGVPDLRAAERIVVHREAGYTALRDLLAGPPMWMNDSF